MAPTNEHGRQRVKTSLIALSSAAVLAVYGAGYVRTRAAAERFAEEPVRRRLAAPVAIRAAAPAATADPLTSSGPPVESASAPAAKNLSPEAVAKAAPIATPRTGAAPASYLSPSPASPSALAPSTLAVPAASADRPAPGATVADAAAVPSLASVATMPMALGALPTSDHSAVLAPPPPAPLYKDGTFKGWGTSRHGDIEATVIVSGGRILSAKISQCYTRYSCSVIDPIPPQVAQRQSPEVDYVSGATESTNAFYYAVIEALTKAK